MQRRTCYWNLELKIPIWWVRCPRIGSVYISWGFRFWMRMLCRSFPLEFSLKVSIKWARYHRPRVFSYSNFEFAWSSLLCVNLQFSTIEFVTYIERRGENIVLYRGLPKSNLVLGFPYLQQQWWWKDNLPLVAKWKMKC